jgi:bacteriocin-like protein
MKKIKFEGKLSLKKGTVAELNDNQMSKINGGKDTMYRDYSIIKTLQTIDLDKLTK